MPSKRTIVLLTAAALALCYASTLRGMADQWRYDDDMGHGFAVPFVILWIVWRERARWRSLPLQPSAWGFAFLSAGMAFQLAGVLGVGLFAASVGFLLSVLGAVVALGGFGFLRAWAFPLVLSIFMLPKLAIVYDRATLPLQLEASRLAAGMLTVAGYGVIRAGNILDVSGHSVLVAEACNGIRYLIPLMFMGALIAYVHDSPGWTRLALPAAAIPLAIVANAARVALVGAWPALDAGTPHLLAGTVIFVFCLAVLAALLRLLPRKARSHA